MECFKIDWKGSYSLDEAQNKLEAREKGIYAIYRAKKLVYVGKSVELGRRISEHNRGWSHFLSEKQRKQCSICIGTIYTYEGSSSSRDISSHQLQMVENYLINELQPEGNSGATKKGHKGLPVIIVNTGKRGKIRKIMCHNPELLKLLKDNLTVKKTELTSLF